VLAAEGPDVVCLRYFNVYGPRQDPASDYAGVIARFLACAAGGQPYTVFGDGRQTRDFVAVQDVVQANLLAADAGLPVPDAADDPTAVGDTAAVPAAPDPADGPKTADAAGRCAVLNVGSGRQTSLLELIDAVDRVTGRARRGRPAQGAPGQVRFEPARDGDIRHSQADVTLARRTLGAVPSTPLDDGLRATWEWFRAAGAAQGG